MSKKLFVGNIDWGTSEEDLQTLFAQCGAIEEAIIVKDKMSGRSKGFGFVTFAEEASAEDAIAKLNGYETNGRKIAVSEARPLKRNRY